MHRTLLFFLSLLSISSSIFAQIDLSGLYLGLDLKAINSPYRVVGDIEIPTDYVLNIEPGVLIQFIGGNEILIHGAVVAEGTATQPIVFQGNNAQNILHFQDIDLSKSSLAYCEFYRATNAIYLNGENRMFKYNKNLLFSETGVKSEAVSGRFGIENSEIRNTTITSKHLVSRANSGLALYNNNIDHSVFYAETLHFYGPVVHFSGNHISNCQFYMQGKVAEQSGAAFQGDAIKNCSFRPKNSHCEFTTCQIRNSEFSRAYDNQADTSELEFVNTLFYNTDFIGGAISNNLGALEVSHYGSIYVKTAQTQNENDACEMNRSIIVGPGDGIGLKTASAQIRSTTIVGNDIGIQSTQNSQPTFERIENSNIFYNTNLNVKNNGSYGFPTTGNWWGTSDSTAISNLIEDFQDNTALGAVSLVSSNPIPNEIPPISPPTEVKDSVVPGGHIISWAPNPEPDLAGYNLHSGNFDGFYFSNVTDLGNVTSFFIPNSAYSPTFGLTAYDTRYPRSSALLAGSESWFGFPSGNLPTASAAPMDAARPQLLLYPNPNTGNFTIDVLAGQLPKRSLSVDILDLSGKTIFQAAINTFPFKVEVPNMPKGFYLARLVHASGNLATTKFLVQ